MSDFDKLKWDIFEFGDSSLHKGDKVNFNVRNKDRFIRNFLKEKTCYQSETHVTLRQIVTHVRKNIWLELADMDKYGNLRKPTWDIGTNVDEIAKALDNLTEEKTEIHTCPEDLEEFLSYFPSDFKPYLFPLEPNDKAVLEDYRWKPGVWKQTVVSKKTGESKEIETPHPGTRVSSTEAIKKLYEGYNIGIAATDSDPLSIMDKDDLEAVGASKLTLATKSRKQIGEHHFYSTNDPVIKGKVNNAYSAKQNIPTGMYGEIRAVWGYVVACGSYVQCNEADILAMPEEDRPYAGHYRLYQRAPIASITYNELPSVYREKVEKTRRTYIEKDRQFKENQKKEKQVYNGKGSAMWDISLYDVTGLRDNPGVHFPIPSEFGHGSDTGTNCCVSNGLLACWRHEVNHNGLTALAVYAGVADCDDGIPFHAHHTGINFKDPKVQWKMWEYAYKHGLLPNGDKIPSTALKYYAESKGIAARVTA
jgi:hypothetical protein